MEFGSGIIVVDCFDCCFIDRILFVYFLEGDKLKYFVFYYYKYYKIENREIFIYIKSFVDN